MPCPSYMSYISSPSFFPCFPTPKTNKTSAENFQPPPGIHTPGPHRFPPQDDSGRARLQVFASALPREVAEAKARQAKGFWFRSKAICLFQDGPFFLRDFGSSELRMSEVCPKNSKMLA